MTYRIPPGLTPEQAKIWLAERRRRYKVENATAVRMSNAKWRAANPKYSTRYNRDWTKTEEGKASMRRWRLNNPDKVREMRREARKRWVAANPEKAVEKKRQRKARYAEKHPDKVKAAQRRNTQRQRERHPEKYAARKAVWLATQRGDLVPLPCKVCGKVAEAHHPDYLKPLEVEWLCRVHHRDEHRRLAAKVSDLFG